MNLSAICRSFTVRTIVFAILRDIFDDCSLKYLGQN